MAGNQTGGAKAAATNKARYGKDFYRIQGAKGGAKGAKDGAIKGFAANRELARMAGARGGKVSRKPKAEPAWSLADDIKAERAKSWRGRIFDGRLR